MDTMMLIMFVLYVILALLTVHTYLQMRTNARALRHLYKTLIELFERLSE